MPQKRTRTRGEGARRTEAGRWEGPSPAELGALDDLGAAGEWEVSDTTVPLTNLDKELLPADGDRRAMTKRDLVRYYTTMAPVLLPYLADRPVNVHRFPDGVAQPGFWQKQVPKHAPAWLTRWHYADARRGESDTYAIVDSVPALAWMANAAAVELHPWTSAASDAQRPTWALIDIDPGPSTTFEDVLYLARLYRAGLDHLSLQTLPKLTGQRGVHIFVPVEPRYTFDETRAWVETLSRAVGANAQDLVSWTWTKSDRRGLARLDYTQNAVNKTLASPYSVRAAPGAPVSVPLEWDELDDAGLRSDHWTVDTAPTRVGEVGDPLLHLIGRPQQLPAL
jgi:bifunctional non-homologous end joining protein LigD